MKFLVKKIVLQTIVEFLDFVLALWFRVLVHLAIIIVIQPVRMNLDATTILSPRIAYVDTVTYFKIVQALTKQWMNLNQVKLELDVLSIEK